ncbi:restriction endonuclease subunit S [Vibrio parahaemolyticus]|uniref:restriction endonuclease subunit S n=1 Tax=Vibrio parahaemolyticus TaxID=670 RepID=UPI001B82D46E|nr:restriction endonuclease subunit S [Vibrio parahaemolyticus]ELA9213650.1 restriction endonuclease subunit S [Vibrio parahaemolyticus]MDF4345313.1 restriction endonuclease subunit S [Vibrio parahaemolyticus]MDF4357393.1 restriction endonuclease subunit S [Vibrio parahaemolyticus]MDF4419187.1 restriction endonuclease subunit S [Vibrio parahaemolyticus]MDF4527165.1 restriction endonuclease subunit S [Vibrio parahaemolyticus]
MERVIYNLPVDWSWIPLGKVATLLNGRAYKQAELLAEGPTPVLRVGNFFSNRSWYYSDLDLPADKYCEEGDLLYAWSASFGPKIWQGPKAIYHYHIWKILPSEHIDKKFLFYLLEKDSEDIKAQGNGVGMFHATKGGMEKMLVPLPPINEQKRIVDKLDALLTRIDTAIEHLQESVTLADALLKNGLSEIFESLKDRYEVVPLSSVVKINSGIALPKLFKNGFSDGDIPFFKVAQMNNHHETMVAPEITFNETVAKEHKIKLFPKGSTLIPKRGGAILTNKKRMLLEDASYDSNIMGLKADESKISDEYLFAFMRTIDLANFVDASTIPQVNNKHIDQMQIPLVSIEEQANVVSRVNLLVKKVETMNSEIQRQLDDLQALKSSILDSAFKGEL